jgi:hypothetical protein
MVMKTMTKLIGLGAIAGGAIGASLLAKRIAARRAQSVDDQFDFGDLEGDDEPVIIGEEIIIVTEAAPYDNEIDAQKS